MEDSTDSHLQVKTDIYIIISMQRDVLRSATRVERLIPRKIKQGTEKSLQVSVFLLSESQVLVLSIGRFNL